IALGTQGQVEAGVARQAIKHMVKEADTCSNVCAPRAIQIEHDLNTTFTRLAADVRGARHHGDVRHSFVQAWMVMRPYIIAILAGLPLLAPEVWSGFRLAQSDSVLSVIAATEQPL